MVNIHSVLVVDDEPLMRDFVGETLERLGCQVRYASEGAKAMRLLEKESFELVFTDMKLPKFSGIDVLQKSKNVSPKTEVVVMTAYGTVENAIDAMKSGASDYLLKPFSPEQVEFLVSKISSNIVLKAQNEYLINEINSQADFSEMVGSSSELKMVISRIEKVADSNASVLISGESGTGKELVARAIHFNSDRKKAPFIKINCAALPASLIESELFGHEKGSFTGAVSQRMGRFELANGGTLFLDEISEMDLSLQAKLLRVIQEREFERIGSNKTIKVDVRILASTNRDLLGESKNGAFREDLYYRLNVVPIHLPPLRDRSSDILDLAQHFLKKTAKSNKKSIKTFSSNAKLTLTNYLWPGNIRELENIIERALILSNSDVIESCDLGLTINDREDSFSSQSYLPGKSISQIEKDYILKTLDFYDGNRTKTATTLDISIRTLRNKLKEYRVNKDLITSEKVSEK